MTPDDVDLSSLRAHHFLCLTTFAGKGYSPEFVANMNRVFGAAQRGEIARLRATAEADPICGACPHLQDRSAADGCTFGASIAARDRRMLRAMGWRENQEVDFAAAIAIILERHRDLMREVCRGCDWATICGEERFTLHPTTADGNPQGNVLAT